MPGNRLEFAPGRAHYVVMITINQDPLPQNCLTYLAFRIAFRNTLERVMLAKQFGGYPDGRFGYLTEVPFLRSVAPHVQLDMLADTWRRHLSSEAFEATLLDESVLYAVCETSARLVLEEPEEVRRYLENGPVYVHARLDHQLAAELRYIHLRMTNNGDFLLISQFEDIPPEESRQLKKDFGLSEQKLEILFEALGRWNMSPAFQQNLADLLSPGEMRLLTPVLTVT